MLHPALHLVLPHQTEIPVTIKSFLVLSNFAVSAIETLRKHWNTDIRSFSIIYAITHCELLNGLETFPEVHFSIIFTNIHDVDTTLGLHHDLKAKKLEYSLTGSERIFNFGLVSYP